MCTGVQCKYQLFSPIPEQKLQKIFKNRKAATSVQRPLLAGPKESEPPPGYTIPLACCRPQHSRTHGVEAPCIPTDRYNAICMNVFPNDTL